MRSEHPSNKNREVKIVDYNQNFTIERLKKSAQFFFDYIDNYGSEPPINTRYSALNSWGLWALSFVPKKIFRVHQDWAGKIVDAVEHAEKQYALDRYLEAIYVFMALQEFQHTYSKMKTGGHVGEVMTNLGIALQAFDLPLEDLSFAMRQELIENKLKRLDEYRHLKYK